MTAPVLASRPLPTAAPDAARDLAPRALTWGDRLFRRGLGVLNRVLGIRVVWARDAHAQMHADAVARTVLGERRVPPDLRHIDARYGRMAVTLVAYHRRTPVGTLTLYLPGSSSRTLESAPLRLPAGVRPWQMVDIGRLAVLPEHRGGARLVLLGLLAVAQRFTEQAGRTYWVGMTHPSLLRVFEALNPTVRPLETTVDDRRPDALVRYWRSYRRGVSPAPAPFILVANGASPRTLLTRHACRLLRARLRGGRSGSRG